jgi:ribosomal protein S18 acetylase RimI-like enzyme
VLTALTKLDDRDIDAVAALARRVTAHDGGRLKLEWNVLRSRAGDRVLDFLWRHDGHVVGFCGLYAFGGEVELAGMVDPAVRRRRIGTALLTAALPIATSNGAAPALLVTPRTTPAGRAFAEAHGGTLDHSEHFLVLGAVPASPTRHADVAIRSAAPADVPHLRRILAEAFGNNPDDSMLTIGDESQRQLVLERDGAVIGCLRLSGDDGAVGIYGFAIEPSLQGQGIGRSVLARVCAELRTAGTREVRIEVAVDNDHALGLYTSLGFEQRTTEDYFAVRAVSPCPARP